MGLCAFLLPKLNLTTISQVPIVDEEANAVWLAQKHINCSECAPEC